MGVSLASGAPGSCPGLPCPGSAGRAPREAARPSEGGPELPEGAGLSQRSCCRNAARAFRRRLPCPVFCPFLHKWLYSSGTIEMIGL